MEISRRWRNVAAVLTSALAMAVVLVWAPAFLAFGLAVAAAVGWCIWLEEHPTLDITAGPRHDRITRLHAGR